jgi:hypothetical protein
MNRMDVIGSLVSEQRRPDGRQTNRGFEIHAQA